MRASLVLAPSSRRLLLLTVPLAILACSSDDVVGPSHAPLRVLTPAAVNGQIAFQRVDDTGTGEIFVMGADGSNPTNLTNDIANDGDPVWSPDGSKIAFRSDRDGSCQISDDPLCNDEIYVMNANGTGVTRLTFNGASDTDMTWSPDGTRIAFETERDGNDEIYVMNADGSNPTNLTNNGAEDSNPDWSSDGTKIAFQSDRDGGDEIFVMNADGSSPAQLTDSGNGSEEPAWSPDGAQIAFQSYPAGSTPKIFVMNADGSNPVSLMPSGDENGEAPAWSPDGTKIAFQTDRDPPFTYDVFVMNADGSNPTNLTSDPDGPEDQAPHWGTAAGAPPPRPKQCADGLDNDDDGNIDHPDDPGCTNAADDSESPDPALKQCRDGQDNDLDGKIDFPADSGCSSSDDDDERLPCDGAVMSAGVEWGPRGSSRIKFYFGTAGHDVIVTDPRSMAIVDARAGNDLVCAGPLADFVTLGHGNDVGYYGAGNDAGFGNDQNDEQYGEAGDDYINGGRGKVDFCSGGPGNDRLVGCTATD